MNQNREREGDRDENDRRPKRQRRNRSEIRPAIPYQEPDLPAQFRDKIRELPGSDINLVIQKILTKTDVDVRLSIRGRQMKNDFLTSEERLRMQEKKPRSTRSKGLFIPLIDPSLNECSLTLKGGRANGFDFYYVLGKTWKEVTDRNGLKEGDSIQLWYYRFHGRTQFVLVKLEE